MRRLADRQRLAALNPRQLSPVEEAEKADWLDERGMEEADREAFARGEERYA
jgi:hypothetical protein